MLNDHWLTKKIRRLTAVASLAFRPPEDIEIDAWAEKSIVLSHRVSTRPGRLRLEPYQRRPLRAIKHHERVVLVWAPQTGKTIIIQIFMGWCIDQNPGPMMVVCPDMSFCKRRSRKHLQPFIQDSDVLSRHLTGDRHDLQLYEYALDTMAVTVAWAGSPSQMAGEPIMILARDEFDKYADATDKEANAFRLVYRRTASYDRLRKILDATTPTIEDADGWQALIGGTYEEVHVPCPHCAVGDTPQNTETGELNPGWQVLKFDQFRYPKRRMEGEEPEELCDWQARIRKEAYCECAHCGKPISESKRWWMVLRGDWVARNPEAPYLSFHLPSWYARTSTNSFGDVAARYVEGCEDPQAMRDWMNNDCAMPYTDLGRNAREDLVKAHMADYSRGDIPTPEPVILIATADLHKLCHFVTVWALTPQRSYLIDWAKVDTPEQIGEIRRNNVYTNPDGIEYGIEAAFPDAGYRTSDVYNLALEDERVIPTTGSAGSALISWTTATHYPNVDRELDRKINVLNISDVHFKEQLLLRFESGMTDEGFDLAQSDWLLPSDTPREFTRHMLGEIAVDSKNSRGYTVREWQKVGPNHYLDCAKIMLGARHVLRENLRNLTAPPPTGQAPPRVVGRKPEGWDQA